MATTLVEALTDAQELHAAESETVSEMMDDVLGAEPGGDLVIDVSKLSAAAILNLYQQLNARKKTEEVDKHAYGLKLAGEALNTYTIGVFESSGATGLQINAAGDVEVHGEVQHWTIGILMRRTDTIPAPKSKQPVKTTKVVNGAAGKDTGATDEAASTTE